jgi:general secretion pathway protein K
MQVRISTSPPSVCTQRGAALLMAMVIVTLVATLASAMVWQQWRATQVEGAERNRAQSNWVLAGALSWPRIILREDQRSGGPDHLGEAWAIPLAEVSLSTFLAVDANNNASTDGTPDAFLSGQIDDATARYNLRNLLTSEGELVPDEVKVLKRLCEYAGLSSALADALSQSLRKAYLASQRDDAEALAKLGGTEARNKAPLMPQSMDQLTWLGLDAGTVERLRPYVTLLPDQTKVNVNTAGKEVIAAAVEGLDLARASRIVQTRQRNPFKSVELLTNTLGTGNWSFARLSVTSDYFEVRGRLRYEDSIIAQWNLVQRAGTEVVVRQQARFSGLDRAAMGSATP